ncbi:MAG: S8 family serine peptidase, partial [Alphaproteobacteria bacterium]|nr:S8 family serine peptidase [Alphaproteobacteria bacterium]
MSFPRTLPGELGQHPADTQEVKNLAEQFKNSSEYNPQAPYRLTFYHPLLLYKDAKHLEMINAHWAHARGATGAGEIVAVTDSFTNVQSAISDEKNSRYGTVRRELGLGTEKTTLLGPVIDRGSHGTKVAAALAANRDDSAHRGNMHGVAFDARLLLRNYKYPGNPGGKYVLNVHAITEQWDKNLAAQALTLDYARKGGAAIVNFSLGLNTGKRLDDYTKETVREKFKHTAKELAQAHTPDAEKIIVVWAAGNRGYTSTGLISGLGVHFPELQKHVLTVVAVGKNGKIKVDSNEEFDWGSNLCGRAKAFCLAAPGQDIIVPDTKSFTTGPEGYKPFGGTSAAAPLVSGGLAVLRQYFSVDHADGTRSYQLGNTELVARLLATANNKGEYANSDIYGHGLMDLNKATMPVGQLLTSLQSDPNAQPFDASAFSVSGNAFGGAMRDSLGGVKIAAFDELDAPFF